MRKTIFLYGLSLAGLIFLLKILEYRFLVRDLSLEFYLGLVAVLFTALGIWVGFKVTRKKDVIAPLPSPTDLQFNENLLKETGISRREYEVLALMAKGLSNQEIANTLFVSLNTIKSHSSNLFIKLNVKRRTQAVQKGKDLGLLLHPFLTLLYQILFILIIHPFG